MMGRFLIQVPLLWLFALVLQVVAAGGIAAKTLYQFPNKGTWLENLAVRRDGRILATRFDAPELFQFTIGPNGKATPQLLYTFPHATSMTGIVEIAGRPDTFAVIVGNFSLSTFKPTPGSWSVWQVDLSRNRQRVVKLGDIPRLTLPNGMVSLCATERAVLIPDSALGNLWRFDLDSGASRVAIEDPLMKSPNASAPLGINGIKLYSSSTLLYTNSNAAILARTSIYANGTAMGRSQVVAHSVKPVWTFDDFAVDGEGVAYVATGTGNSITKITPDGKAEVIAGDVNSTEIAEPTSLAFGRIAGDSRTLYITTGGAQGDPVNGTVVVGAQLLSITLR